MKKLKSILIISIVIAILSIGTTAYAEDDENSPFLSSGTFSNNALINIGFTPSRVVMDPTQDVAYITKMSDYFLYRADLNTGEMSYLRFKYRPGEMIVRNGNIYLILYHGSYPTSSVSVGTIVVIDTSTFTMTSYFDLQGNPYDIEMDNDGFLYISSGPDNYNKLESYNPVTGELVSENTIKAYSILEYNSQYNKLYSLYMNGTPMELSSYKLSNGEITSVYRSPYNYEYSAGWPMIISPDKQLLFAGGNIFNSASASSEDMTYHDTIDGFSSIAFDSDSGVFYTIDKEETHNLMTYDYSSLTVTGQFIAKYFIKNIFFNNDRLVYLQSKTYETQYFFTFSPEKSPYITDVTGISLDRDSINIMPGDRERLLCNIIPSNASIQGVTWSSSDPSVATYDDYEVFGHSVGTCVFTATTIDGGYSASCIVNVSPTPYVGASETSINAFENLGFAPLDVALDPNDKIAYLTEVGGNKLYRVDLVSGDVRYMEFIYNAECLTIRNDGELYLSLGRTYYPGYQYETGEVVVINTENFTVSECIDMPNTPKDIITDGEQFLYVNFANNDYGLVTYDTNTWAQINNHLYTPTNTITEYNDKYNKIYSVNNGSPDDLYAYKIVNGIIANIYDSPYHGDYEMNSYIKVSPDGEYIFNSTGNIFTCKSTKDGDMLFHNKIDSFTAVCFDEGNSKFYTCIDNILKEYNIADQSFVKSYMMLDEIYDVFYEYGKITAIQINSAGDYYFSTINPFGTIDPYVATGTSPNNGLINLGFVPKDIAIDDVEGAAYLTEVDGKKLYKVNLTTGEMHYMEFIFPAESLTVGNGKVYVSLLHRPHSPDVSSASSGTIAIVDSASFVMDDFFAVELDPYDIEVDNQGIAYIGPGSNQFSIVASYDTATGEQLSFKQGVKALSLWDYNQRYNKLYSISADTFPRDINGYEINEGIITNYYDSPYHGQYEMSTYMKVSPDGQYIFNGSGNIFTCAPANTGDMIFDEKIHSFSSICFDLDNNDFYSAEGNVLLTYKYDTLEMKNIITSKDEFVEIFYSSNELIFFQKNAEEQYFFTFELDMLNDTIYAQSIAIDDAEYVPVLLGNSETLNVIFSPINATNKNVVWSTSDPAVATVIDGVVYGNSTGTCEISATSEDGGYIASCTVNVLSQQENQKIAILFGMSDYDDLQNDLNGPVNDMIALEAVLERSGYIVFKYMDYGADELLYRVTDVASKLSSDSTMLFAYSGHGVDGGYLLGADNYGISLYDLKRCLSIHTGVKEIIIDACYSGDLIGKGTKMISINVIETQEDFNDFVISVFKNENLGNSSKDFAIGEDEYYVITSSSGSQLSYELLFEIQNSPFAIENLVSTNIEGKTYYWMGFFGFAFDDGFGLYNSVPFSEIQANKNSDGFLTWEELFNYVRRTTGQFQSAQVYPENSNHIIWSIKDSANVPVSDLAIGENILLDNRKSRQIIHTIIPANAGNKKVIYASENQDIASISETGLIFGHELGSTTVTVTTEDGGFTQTATVTVYDSDINGDNKVDMLDIVILAQEYSNDISELDLNIDGIVNLFDIILVAKGIG